MRLRVHRNGNVPLIASVNMNAVRRCNTVSGKLHMTFRQTVRAHCVSRSVK